MRSLFIALVALEALTLRAAAQTPMPAAGSEQIYFIVTVTVDDMDKFKRTVRRLVAATEKEPGTLQYEYAVGPDQKTVDIYERYSNSKTANSHLTDNFLPNFVKELTAVAKIGRFSVYGTASDELKKTLADLHPSYMTPFDGFIR